MLSLFDDQLIDDVVSRAEQSRASYNLQTEEFRTLNANLQSYLGDIKTIDDDNHQLQENIEQIRTKYILQLENHLKLLPNDFRVQSQILTDAHLERYKLKSRTRRFISEREEIKRRINFVATNEKDQIKHLNILQKQERLIHNEYLKLNEQLERLLKYVENEKQTYRQAMDKVDDLQTQLEQICIERSKTEFEIQTLKEEVKLMQTTKEFLNEERETILSTQTEANEYLLSRLNDSINRIREDFDQLNKTQLQQIENDYKQILQNLEENLINNQTKNTSQEIIPSEYERLENEHQSVLQELTTLNDQNQILSQRILAMENDLHSLRNERMQQLILKDNELEYSKIELQTLSEKLNHLAEYDRNLKFELTLYRGVLESEYRRKQSSNNIHNLTRPTTLRTTNKNLITDRTTWLASNANQNKFNDQQQEEILTTRNRVQSDYDLLGQDITGQINDVISTKTPSKDEKLISGETLWQQLGEPLNSEQQPDKTSENIITQGTRKPLSSFSTSVLTEDQSISLFEVQQSASRTSSISTKTRKSPTSSTPPISREDQPTSSQAQHLSTTPPELRSLSTTPPSNKTTSPTNTTAFAFEVHQSSSTSPQEHQPLSELQQASSRTSSISARTPSDVQKSPLSATTATVPESQPPTSNIRQTPSTPSQEHQPSSRTSSIGSKTSSGTQRILTVPESQSLTSEIRQTPSTPPQEHQPSSLTSSISLKTSPDIQKSLPSATTPTVPESQPLTSDILQIPSISSQEHQPSSRTSSISEKTPSDIQKSPLSATTPTVPEHQLLTSDIHQTPSTPPQEYQPSSRTSSISSKTSPDIQKSPPSATTPTVPESQPLTSDILQTPSISSQEHQPSSHNSSISEKTPSDIQKSLVSTTTPTVPESQPPTSDILQTPSISSQEHQPSSRTSSTSEKTPSDIQNSLVSTATPAVPESQPLTSDIHQTPSTPLQEHQPPSRTSSINSNTSSDIQRSPIVPEYQPSTSDIRQTPSTPPEEHQPSSRTSSINARTSSDIQKSLLPATTSTISEYQSPTSDISESPSAPPQEHQPSSRTSSISSKTSEIRRSSLATTPISPEYQPPTSGVRRSSSIPSEEYQPSSRTASISSKTSFNIQKSPTTPEHQLPTSDVRRSPSIPLEEHQPSSRTPSISSKSSSDIQTSPFSATSPTVPEYQPPTFDVHRSPSTPSEDHEPSTRTSSIDSKTSLDIQKSSTTAGIPTIPQDQSLISDVPQSLSKVPEERETSSEVQKSRTDSADVPEKISLIDIDDYQIAPLIGEFGNENQLTKSFNETDDNTEYEESASYTTDEKAISEVDQNERRQPIHFMGPSLMEEFEVSLHTKPNELRSSSFTLTSIPEEEKKLELSQSDTNLSLNDDNKSEFKQDETSNQIRREEHINSSLIDQTEENDSTRNISSTTTDDHNLNEFDSLRPQDITKEESSHYSSLTDIAEVELSTSQKLETKSDDNEDDPNLAAIMQDLRHVFHELANREDLIEIDYDLPDQILDRLEFRDHFIRTLFDNLIRKYLVQEVVESNRPETLDWIEFRDILFPIITGRYTERHIRKLFDLFDTSRDGYLSLQEISELLEVLHANDTIDLAQNIIDEFDTDHDGKLSVDELIEAIKKTDDINEHALSEETENKQWFNQSPTETQTITLEVPIVNFPLKTNEKFTKGISLLGRIFKKVGANFNTKQLDSSNENLSMQLTNEFINNNINISSDDLQFFIQLFLDKKQNTSFDSLINWIEFRDTFFPIINNGYYTKNHIKIWFEIFDTNQNGMITQEQVTQLLHLLQIENAEEIIDKLIEITDNSDSWTFDELMLALDCIDETASHLLTNNEQISSFDIDWLSNNIF